MNRKQPPKSAIKQHNQTIIIKLYQYFRLSSAFLYCTLLARWLILYPLVGNKWLPGGIHEYLIYLLLYSFTFELVWQLKFFGFYRLLTSRSTLKCINFLYFVISMHFYDDYEHAVALKNISYSGFIVGLGFNQAYYHCKRLFKQRARKSNRFWLKANTFVWLPLLYISEFYLLLLNIQNPNFHSIPIHDIINKIVLVGFIPISLQCYKMEISSL
ncbi:Keg1p Ecym_2579 [Eremothecium cymbalariae DBVPG|uniref:Very-long-chain (3R)-3-hydroxyacyl-CoA dehydratase n=1 Tax=Eremothecium cymbalariae (strain CBS 270.75 / DBVPG 7215 / KCTC 17166 / NRRL Y-17582) TaxID=931890 RepID=G8JQG2_ERECY|nr:Hypothetical protein Ecym_2579 [Eremothecium cymbalariae DBVPG\